MNIPKPITPHLHGLLDYALVGSLLTLPAALGLNSRVQKIYAIEALARLGYVALTDHPTALKPLIPFRLHGRIDPFNVAQFALHTGWKAFRKQPNAQRFNVGFTALAGLTVLLTDWNGPTHEQRS